MVKDMLDVPKPVTDASSDYSDDFDESSDNDDSKIPARTKKSCYYLLEYTKVTKIFQSYFLAIIE